MDLGSRIGYLKITKVIELEKVQLWCLEQTVPVLNSTSWAAWILQRPRPWTSIQHLVDSLLHGTYMLDMIHPGQLTQIHAY